MYFFFSPFFHSSMCLFILLLIQLTSVNWVSTSCHLLSLLYFLFLLIIFKCNKCIYYIFFSDNCNIWNFRSNFILLVLAYNIIHFCTIFIIYYVTGRRHSAGDTRMNKTLVKVAAVPHASRPLQDNVVSSLTVIWCLCHRHKDERQWGHPGREYSRVRKNFLYVVILELWFKEQADIAKLK